MILAILVKATAVLAFAVLAHLLAARRACRRAPSPLDAGGCRSAGASAARGRHTRLGAPPGPRLRRWSPAPIAPVARFAADLMPNSVTVATATVSGASTAEQITWLNVAAVLFTRHRCDAGTTGGAALVHLAIDTSRDPGDRRRVGSTCGGRRRAARYSPQRCRLPQPRTDDADGDRNQAAGDSDSCRRGRMVRRSAAGGRASRACPRRQARLPGSDACGDRDGDLLVHPGVWWSRAGCVSSASTPVTTASYVRVPGARLRRSPSRNRLCAEVRRRAGVGGHDGGAASARAPFARALDDKQRRTSRDSAAAWRRRRHGDCRGHTRWRHDRRFAPERDGEDGGPLLAIQDAPRWRSRSRRSNRTSHRNRRLHSTDARRDFQCWQSDAAAVDSLRLWDSGVPARWCSRCSGRSVSTLLRRRRLKSPAAPGQPSAEALTLRSLLEDRFQLTTHRETREVPVYALVLARSDGRLGPHIRRPATDFCAQRAKASEKAPQPFGEVPCAGFG